MAKLLPAGRLVELSGVDHGPTARTTTAVSILAHAQQQGETTVWLQPAGGALYPPDLAETGIDLESLVVIHIPASAGPHGACKAAELLLRSGAFGLVVVDLCAGVPPGSGEAWQGRLLGLARQHHARVVLLTEKPAHTPSLGPLVGVRVEPTRQRAPTADAQQVAVIEGHREGHREGHQPKARARLGPRRGRRPGRFTVQHTVIKNKTGKRIEPTFEVYRGPWGL